MRFFSTLLILPLLAACATLTEEQCQTGDWSSIGYNDGLNGRAQDYVSNHFEACSELGISPDIRAWEAGREQGLLRYCTPENAYITGRNGNRFNNVCAIDQRASLDRAFDWGAEYYVLTQEILALTDEKYQIEILIASTLSHPNPTPEEVAQRASLESRIRRLDLNIWHLEIRRERYSVPPF